MLRNFSNWERLRSFMFLTASNNFTEGLSIIMGPFVYGIIFLNRLLDFAKVITSFYINNKQVVFSFYHLDLFHPLSQPSSNSMTFSTLNTLLLHVKSE